MRPTDLIVLALSGLWRQKLRTLLTLTGVLIGCAVLTVSLAVGGGVRGAVEQQFRKNDRLRRIDIYPDYQSRADESEIPPEAVEVVGEMSDAKRARIREKLVERHAQGMARSYEPITPEALDAIATWEHVEKVVPAWYVGGRVALGDRVVSAQLRVAPADHPDITARLDFGTAFSSPDAREVIVSEMLLYDLGIADDRAVEGAIGRPVRIELDNSYRSNPNVLLGLFNVRVDSLSAEEVEVLRKSFEKLKDFLGQAGLSEHDREVLRKLFERREPEPEPEIAATVAGTFRIAGVYRVLTKEDEKHRDPFALTLHTADMVMPRGSGEPFVYQLPGVRAQGAGTAAVYVTHEDHTRVVEARLKGLRYSTFSLAEFVDQVRTNLILIGFALNFIALIALFVAALGITNTLFTSVIERTREIGILKAVGAKDRHVQVMFLMEGATIGLLGGALGLLVGWALSMPGEAWARSLMAKQTNEEVPEDLFLYPWWVLVGVPLFAVTITTLAALYPARRAARVHPVVALRHE